MMLQKGRLDAEKHAKQGLWYSNKNDEVWISVAVDDLEEKNIEK